MRKKERQKVISAASALAGSLPWPDDVCEKMQPFIMSSLLLGYYMGLGHDTKTASQKARKFMDEVLGDE
jgi:hypothetical protein